MSEPPTAAGQRPIPRRRPTIRQVAGEMVLTAGALLLLFVIYEAFWTNLAAARLQDQAAAELEQQWDNAPAPAPTLGEAFARVHLPALGEDAVYAVVEGTRNEDLRTGPGHYPETQMPGERGNFALAGHRNGSGAVFQYLDRLGSCDAVVVETQTQWMTYRLLPVEADGPERQAAARECLTPEQAQRVTSGDYSHVQGRHITTPNAVEVIEPVPSASWADKTIPGTAPAPEPERMLTLTTCHPQFSNAERMIVHAVLVETTSKANNPLPTALKE